MTCKLTLLCPSFERHRYLERSCRFWGDRDDVCVIYADGSQSQFDSPVLNASNLRYFHRPNSFQERLLWLIDQAETPYVCMLSDDEFYLPSSLRLCVDFLEKHPDYVACMGRAIGFSRLNGKVALHEQYPRLKDRDLCDSSPLTRLESHFSAYTPSHFYAVTRTDVFRNALKVSLSIEWDVYALFELVTEFLIVASGKSIVLPALYWLRSREVPPLRNTGYLALDPAKSFVHWWRSNEFESQKIDFCNCLSVASSKVVDVDEVRRIFHCYFNIISGNAPIRDQSSLKRLKLDSLLLIMKYLRALKARGGILIDQLIHPDPRNMSALQELRDQGVSIDEVLLAQCFSSIKGSWRG